MKKSGFAMLASVLIITGCATGAGQQQSRPEMGMTMGGMTMPSNTMMMDMKNTDANGDGVISKDEFMKSHEAMFDAMKNKDGVIDAKEMAMHCNMMGSMMGHGGMDHDHMGKPNQ